VDDRYAAGAAEVIEIFAAALPLLLIALLILQRRHRVNRTVSPLSAVSGLGEEINTLVLRDDAPGVCPNCGLTSPSLLYLEYRRISFMYLLGFVNERRYFRRCRHCSAEEEIDRASAESQVATMPKIPSTNMLFVKIVVYTLAAFVLFAIVGELLRSRT
jgi:hypothetical protein